MSADALVTQPFFAGTNTSDPDASGGDLFRNPKNHVDAVASILAYSANIAYFHPNTDSLAASAQNYQGYIKKISTFPGFFLEYNQDTESYHTSADVKKMIDDVKKAYDGVIGVDEKILVDSIQKMAATVLSQLTDDAQTVLFDQTSIFKDDGSDKVRVAIFSATLKMKKERSGKRTYADQSYRIKRSVYQVIPALLAAKADDFAYNITKTSLDSWLSASRSPTSGDVKTCFSDL